MNEKELIWDQLASISKECNNSSMLTLQLPYPVSMNSIWRVYKGRQVQSKEAIKYKNEVKYIATQKKHPITHDNVSVILELQPKQTISGRAYEKCIDLDNCIKATLDALQGVIIANDKQVKRIYAYYGDPIPGGGLLVTIEKYA